MEDHKKYKVGITPKEPWADNISYEVLDMTLYAVENEGDGCSYVALKDNIGVRPGTDPTVWLKSSQAGQSIYDLAVKYGHFVGTEEEFEAQYQQVLQDARDAATATNATNAEVTAAEALRVTAEQGRVSAESGRVSAEATRVSNEEGRVSAESGRVSAESSRVSAEEGRVSAESGRVSAEEGRVSAEAGRVSAESGRVAEWGGMKTDVTTAIGQADAATARAIAAAENVEADHTQYVADHSQASNDHTRAESDHSTASDDHTTAVSDHGTAGDDHTVATSDHGTAADDHTLAGTDHSTAASDHTTAGNDHTRAESDHTRAEEDHAAVASKADKDTDAVDGNLAQFDANGNPVDSGEKIGDFAKQDGYYEKMGVGIAKNLEGRTAVTDAFFARTTGGEADISNGTGQLQEVKGNSQVWNQLVKNGNFADGATNWVGNPTVADGVATLTKVATGTAIIGTMSQLNIPYIDGHKYLIIATVKSGNAGTQINILPTGDSAEGGRGYAYYPDFTRVGFVYTRLLAHSGTSLDLRGYNNLDPTLDVNFSIKNVVCIDLTLLGIDNLTTVDEVEAWLAENVGLFEYYPYNSGSVVNVNMTGLESSGQNLLNPTTGKVEIIGAYSEVYGNYYGIVGTHGALTFVDSQGNESTITPDSDGKFLLETPGVLSVATPGADCSVFHWWDGSKTDYTEYGNDVANLDVTHIYGKKNGTGDLVRVWPTGMPGLGSLQDMLTVEGGEVVARRKMGEVDMGTLVWGYLSSLYMPFTAAIPSDCKNYTSASDANLVCSKYSTYNTGTILDKSVTIQSNNVRVKDTAYSDAASFKTAVTGQILYYELATEQVYTDLVYQGSSIFADGTPVTLPINYNVDNWGDETVLPRNSSAGILTAKPTITSRYSIDAVETLDTHGTEIENLHEQDAVLDAKKPNKAGEYNDFVAGAAKSLIGSNSVPAEFIFRKSPGGKGVVRIDKVKGKSVVWNQWMKEINTTNYISGNTKISIADGKVTYTGNGVSYYGHANMSNPFTVISGHSYLFAFNVGNNTITKNDERVVITSAMNEPAVASANIYGKTGRIGTIVTASSNREIKNVGFSASSAGAIADGETCSISNIVFIDLTLMFGAGNEPSTVEEFEAMYPLPYYAYNAGEIVNNGATAIEAVGFNQWDEEWEEGRYDITTGAKSSASDRIRCKNFIPVLPETAYYYRIAIGASVNNINILYYDAAKNFISFTSGASNPKTTPANCHYVNFYIDNVYGNTYNHDICINISDPSRNGTYEPYKKVTVNLNIPTLTGKLNGEGEPVTIFPDGMKSAPAYNGVTVFDEATKTNVTKRLAKKVFDGTESWTAYSQVAGMYRYGYMLDDMRSGTAAAGFSDKFPVDLGAWGLETEECLRFGQSNNILYLFLKTEKTTSEVAALMSGSSVIYELATPEEYTLDSELILVYEEESGSTERRLPDDTASAVNAALALDITYPMDAVKQLNDMPKDYANVGTLDSLLSTLGTALNGTITKTWDATNQKYTFTFTPNA